MSPVILAKWVVPALLLLTLSGCFVLGGTVFRYRETITYEVGGKQLQVSGVREVYFHVTNFASRGEMVNAPTEGAAIELPGIDGRKVFATMRHPYTSVGIHIFSSACRVYPRAFPGAGGPQRFVDMVKRTGGPCKADPEDWPLLVDVDGRVEALNPNRMNLPGHALARIISVDVSRTNDPIDGALDPATWPHARGSTVTLPTSPAKTIKLQRSDFFFD